MAFSRNACGGSAWDKIEDEISTTFHISTFKNSFDSTSTTPLYSPRVRKTLGTCIYYSLFLAFYYSRFEFYLFLILRIFVEFDAMLVNMYNWHNHVHPLIGIKFSFPYSYFNCYKLLQGDSVVENKFQVCSLHDTL